MIPLKDKFFHASIGLALSTVALTTSRAAPIEVSEPQGITVSIYDTGIGMINEARRVTLTPGEAELVIRQLPARMEPASASFGATARTTPFELLDQTFAFDFADRTSFIRRMIGQPVVIQGGGTSREGILLAAPLGETAELPIRSRDGTQVWWMGLGHLSEISFPFGRDQLAVEPQLRWRVQTKQEGPQSFRLAYRTEGLRWRAHYEIFLSEKAGQADFQSRIEINNQSGGRFPNARVRLLATEKGMSAPAVPGPDSAESGARPGWRYSYGETEPSLERSIASLNPMEVYELPRTITLDEDRPAFMNLIQSLAMPVKNIFVYDGVRFDRFQRNRRTDWNFGTESHTIVHQHLEFENAQKFGLGIKLPPGRCRLYQTRADGTVDLIGEEWLLAVPVDKTGNVQVGPVPGLAGERERTGYVEVKPHHVYDESFQIRLVNRTEQTVEIRVVEHLYRWPDYEIIRSDTDYTPSGPQTIEFRVELRPSGQRSVNYTVRYSW